MRAQVHMDELVLEDPFSATRMEPQNVAQAAEAELRVHVAADKETRRAAAQRARAQLDDVEQLFGTRLGAAGQRRGT